LKARFIRRRIKSGTVFSIIGILLIFGTVGMIYFWETVGREKYLYKEVVVLSQNVEANTQVTHEMLTLLKINPSNFIDGAIVKKEDVAGRYSSQFIAKNSQVCIAYFKDSAEEDIKEYLYIFSIPQDWLITFPNSLRKGDIIYFYPVLAEAQKEGQDNTFNNLDNLKIIEKTKIIENEVAYLKDSGNREVVDTDDNASKPRYDASSNISSIEILTDYENLLCLHKLAGIGYKFIILYKDKGQ